MPYRCDLSNEEDILSMFSAVRSQHSGVDICINNAGLARPDTLLSGSTSGWKDMFNVRAADLWLGMTGMGERLGEERGARSQGAAGDRHLLRGAFSFLPGALSPASPPLKEREWMNGHIFFILLSFEPLGAVLKV